MKNQIIKLFVLLFIAGFVSACGNEGDANGQNDQEGEQHERHEGHGEEGMDEVHLSNLKFKSLGFHLFDKAMERFHVFPLLGLVRRR